MSLQKGQNVEVLSKPPGSRSWRVRVLDDELEHDVEGFVPAQLLKKADECLMRGKRSSVETLNSQSSEGEYYLLFMFPHGRPEINKCQILQRALSNFQSGN